MAASHAFASADAPRAHVGFRHDSFAGDAGDKGAGDAGSAFSRPQRAQALSSAEAPRVQAGRLHASSGPRLGLPMEANDCLGSVGGEGGAAGILANRDCESFIFE